MNKLPTVKREPQPQRLMSKTEHIPCDHLLPIRFSRLITFGMQAEILSALLQEPDLYTRYPGLWNAEHFNGHVVHYKIARTYIRLRETNGEHPSWEQLKAELKRTYSRRAPGFDHDMWVLLQTGHDLSRCFYNHHLKWIERTLINWVREQASRNAFCKAIEVGERNWDEAYRLIDEARKVGITGAPIINAQNFIESEVPERIQLVKGLLKTHSKFLISAPSKARKSYLLLDLAASVSAGEDWLGFETSPVEVLLVNLELHDDDMQPRLKDIAKAKRIRDLSHLDLWNLRGEEAEASVIVERIISKVQSSGKRYSMIILDPIYALLGERDENSAKDIADLFKQIERIITETGAAVVMAHHFAKGAQGAKTAMDRPSGSGVFYRNPDSLATFTELNKPESLSEMDWANSPAFVVNFSLRSFKPIAPVGVRWEHPLMVKDETISIKEVPGKPGRKQRHTYQDILALLPIEGLSTKDWQEIAKDNGIGGTTFTELKSFCVAASAVKNIGTDRNTLWAVNREANSPINEPQP